MVVQPFNDHSHYSKSTAPLSDAIRSFPVAIQGSKPVQNHYFKVFRHKWKSGNSPRESHYEILWIITISVRNLSHKRLVSSPKHSGKCVFDRQVKCFSGTLSWWGLAGIGGTHDLKTRINVSDGCHEEFSSRIPGFDWRHRWIWPQTATQLSLYY